MAYVVATATSERGLPGPAGEWLGYGGLGLMMALIATVVVGGAVIARGRRRG